MIRCSTAILVSLVSLVALPQTAAAQSSDIFASSDIYNIRSSQHDVTAGARLTIPFGAQRKTNIVEDAKFGFAVSVERRNVSNWSGVTVTRRSDLIDFGFILDQNQAKPDFKLAGQNVTATFAGPLYADETDVESENKTDTTNSGSPGAATAGFLVGAVVATGVLVVLTVQSFENQIEEIGS